jgi:glutamate--cysteine ligase
LSSLTFDDATPIESLEQLAAFMGEQTKPPAKWVVGTEHEKFGWLPDLQRAPTYEGPRGIGKLLEALVAERGWNATYEGDAIVALERDGARITLEPGGQFELSGAPLRRLIETKTEFEDHLAEIREMSAPLGIEWSGLGAAPSGLASEAPQMPKGRYGVMRRYLPTRGSMALDMMHSTCTVQANFDFADEADAMRKLRASLYVQPLVIAMFGNSTVYGGVLLDDVRSMRMRIWEDTDNDRYVWPARFLDEDAGFIDYVRWAVDVPMFFFVRGDTFVDCAGLKFSDFMANGLGEHRATMGDWALHLSTLFPDARLKQYLEVRGADMGSEADVLALPALHMGLLYDAEALQTVLDRFAGVTYEAWWDVRNAAVREGLNAQLLGRSLKDWAVELVALAKEGLQRWEPEAVEMLTPLADRVAQGLSPADLTRATWTGDINALYAATRIA